MPLSGPVVFLLTFCEFLLPWGSEWSGKTATYCGQTAWYWARKYFQAEVDDSGPKEALSHLGASARIVVPKIMHNLDRPDGQRSFYAFQLLGHLEPYSPRIRPKLISLLDSPDPGTRYEALIGLMWIPEGRLKDDLPKLFEKLPVLNDDEIDAWFRMASSAGLKPGPDHRFFAKLLLHPQAQVRRNAVMWDRDQFTPELVPALKTLLADRDEEIRGHALRHLCTVHSEGAELLALLVKGLQHPVEEVRRAAWKRYHALGVRAKPMTPLLLKALPTTQGWPRNLVARALWIRDRHPDALVALKELCAKELCGNADDDVRVVAWETLIEHHQGQKAALDFIREKLFDPATKFAYVENYFSAQGDTRIDELLVEMLWHRNPELRLRALCILAHKGSTPEKPLPPRLTEELLRCCRDPGNTPVLRFTAAEILWRLKRHPAALSHIPLLLAEREIPVRERVNALQKLPWEGLAKEKCIHHVLLTLQSDEPKLRLHAAHILAQCEQATDDLVMALMAALNDKETSVRAAAAHGLGRWGKAARKAIPSLILLLEDPQGQVICEALNSLAALKAEEELLLQAASANLQHHEDEVRIQALITLLRLGTKARPALPHVLKAAADQDEVVRATVAELLGVLGIVDEAVMRCLNNLCHDPQERVRVSAIDAYRTLQVLPVAMEKQLLHVLFHGEGLEKLAAATTLWKLKRHPFAQAVLRNGMRDTDGQTREYGFACIRRLGAEAAFAVPALHALIKDGEPYPQALAAEALWLINQDPQAMTTLAQCLAQEHGWWVVRDSLERLGPAAKPLLPALRQELLKPDVSFDSIKKVIRRIAPDEQP